MQAFIARLEVRITGSEHVPPQLYLVPKLMEDYFLFFQKNAAILHPVILAAEMHERLVSIHPFIDGNGRTARLVMNLILLSHGYPLVILKGDLTSRQSVITMRSNKYRCTEMLLHFMSCLSASNVLNSIQEHIALYQAGSII
jgi:Fic family protein